MKIQQIRHATNKITYGGKTFLVDPWLVKKGGMGAFTDIPGHPFATPDPVKEQLAMPFYDLPFPIEEVLKDVDYYILTHIHPDHIDMAADGTVGAFLDKTVPIFVQNEADAAVLKASGFETVHILTEEGAEVDGIRLVKAPGVHGTVIPCGDACGVVFSSSSEKTLYIAGDTIWYSAVAETIKKYNPAVITLNACAAELVGFGRLIMGDEDVACVRADAPHAKLFITHMDNVAHANITRYSMKGLLAGRGITDYDMPEDGETVVY